MQMVGFFARRIVVVSGGGSDPSARSRVATVQNRAVEAAQHPANSKSRRFVCIGTRYGAHRLSERRGWTASISPVPPQTSQRHWPVPLHSLQLPIAMPAIDRLPLPLQRAQQVILWPWHLGHKNLLGISSLPFA